MKKRHSESMHWKFLRFPKTVYPGTTATQREQFRKGLYNAPLQRRYSYQAKTSEESRDDVAIKQSFFKIVFPMLIRRKDSDSELCRCIHVSSSTVDAVTLNGENE